MKMMMMVVTLLLLLSGDIETNPGPVGEHIVIYSSCQFDIKHYIEVHGNGAYLAGQCVYCVLSGNKLTADDLGCVFEVVLDVSPQWYNLGLQLKLRTGTLDRIYAQFRGDPRDQLRETLKTWLTTSDNPSWRTLADALKGRSVGATQLAADLETKYCPVEGTDANKGRFASDS